MNNNKYKILLIEDEANICSFVETLLTTNGYQVILADNCAGGHFMFMSHTPDLVILDLGLPDKDGIEFIKNIRKNQITPIIVLSARSTEKDKITALDYGANDYITKPFGNGELLARVRAVLRNNRHSADTGSLLGGKFIAGGFVIDYDKRRVYVDGQETKLSQIEYNIVAFLSEHSGRVLTYASIVRAIWGSTDYGSTKKLQVNMANIRKKFGSRPGENSFILNELGVGYRMVDEDSNNSEKHETKDTV